MQILQNIQMHQKHPIKSFIAKGSRLLKTILFPPVCLACQTYLNPERFNLNSLESRFCDSCLQDSIYRIKVPYCIKCGIQLPESHLENHICGTCHENPLPMEKVRAVFEYKGCIKQVVPMFKYQSRLSLSRSFEHAIFQSYLKHFHSTGIELIIPIPLHVSKLRQRGFNQAYLLVRRFKQLYRKETGSLPEWEISTGMLKRIKNTQPQTGFDIKSRKNNLNNAFKVMQPDHVKDKSILLVDDVLTTGATCSEAAKALLKNGAGKVQALVLARA